MCSKYSESIIRKLEETRDIDGLIKALDVGSGFDVSRDATEALLRIKDDRIIPGLIKALDTAAFRIPAVNLLGKIGNVNVLQPLEKVREKPLDVYYSIYFEDDITEIEQLEKKVLDAVEGAINNIKKRYA